MPFSARDWHANMFPGGFAGMSAHFRDLFTPHTVSFFRGSTRVDARGDIEICLSGRFDRIGTNMTEFAAIAAFNSNVYVAPAAGGIGVLNVETGAAAAISGAVASNTYAHIGVFISNGNIGGLTTAGRLHVVNPSNGEVSTFAGGTTYNDFSINRNVRTQLIAAVRTGGGVDNLTTGRAVRAGTNSTVYNSCAFITGDRFLCSGGGGLESVDVGDGTRRTVGRSGEGNYVHMVHLGNGMLFAIRHDNVTGQLNGLTGEFEPYAAMAPALHDVAVAGDGAILAVADGGGVGRFTFTSCPTAEDKIGGLANLPKLRYNTRMTRRAGRYSTGATRTVVLTNPIIEGVLSIDNGAPGDVEVILAAARHQQFWIVCQNLFPTDREHAFPFRMPASPIPITQYGLSAFYVTSSDVRRAGPTKNLTEDAAIAELRFSGHWLHTRAMQPGAIGSGLASPQPGEMPGTP